MNKTPSQLDIFTGDQEMVLHVHKPGLSEKVSLNQVANFGKFIEKNIGEIVFAYRLVYSDENGDIKLASADNLDCYEKVLGILKNNFTKNETGKVFLDGQVIQNLGWNFNLNKDLYLGLNGIITEDSSLGLIQQKIGHSISSNEIFLDFDMAIVR